MMQRNDRKSLTMGKELNNGFKGPIVNHPMDLRVERETLFIVHLRP